MNCIGLHSDQDLQITIDDLPNEVFERIIAHLNVEDCKIASLVNYKWSQFSFSRKALAKVQLEINCAQRSALDYWNVLERSCRNYRNLVLKFADDDEGFLLRILNRFQHSLERVSIEQDADARLLHTEISSTYLTRLMQQLSNVRHLTIKTIIELSDSVDGALMPRLERLEEICLYTHCLEEDYIDWTQVCPNVKCVGVPLQDGRNGFPHLIKHFSNQLESLSIDARFIERDSLDFIVQEDFPKLGKFRILYPINSSSAERLIKSFLRNCPHLTEISLFSNTIDQETVQTLAEHCPLLVVISLDTNQAPPSIFSILSKLPRLKQLILHKLTVEPAMIISSNGCFPALRQLTCLSIRINCPEAFFQQLHKKMPKLTVLELLDRFRFGISNFNQNGVVPALCSYMRNIRRLALVDWAILDLSVLEKLSLLENLVELRLKCIGLNPNKLLSRCSSVRKLVLDVDTLKPTDVIPPVSRPSMAEIISSGFPELTNLEMRRQLLDLSTSEQEIEALRSKLPGCAFYRKTRLQMADKDYTALL